MSTADDPPPQLPNTPVGAESRRRPAIRGPVPRGWQLIYMGGATFIVVFCIATFQSHAPTHAIPNWVWGAYAVFIPACIAAGFDELRRLGSPFLGEPYEGVRAKAWRSFRDTYGHLLVNVGAVVNTLLLWECVKHTGGPFKSPFVPMLSAPALFGAFVSQTALGITELVVGASGFLLWVNLHAHGPPDSTWYAYYVPELALLLAAGGISIAQLRRDQWLRRRREPLAHTTELDDETLQTLGRAVVGLINSLTAAQKQHEGEANASDEPDDSAP